MADFGIGGFVFSGLSGTTAAAAAVAAAVVLTGLYLLKLRRRRVLVPFAPLWLPAGGERRSERLARRLRRWLSLLVQLVFVALILLAAADPQSAKIDRRGRSLLICTVWHLKCQRNSAAGLSRTGQKVSVSTAP